MAQPERSLHIVLLGDDGIGQSTLLRRFRGDDDDAESECKLESFIATAEVNGELHRVRLTDSAGRPCFDRLRKPVLSTAHTILLCFAIDRESSLGNIESKWFPLVRSLGISVPVIVLGLRSDLRESASQCVSEEQGLELSKKLGAVGYLECSATDPEVAQEVLEKALLTAKEYYGYHWQQTQQKRSHTTASDSHMEELRKAGEEDDYLAQTVMSVDDVAPLNAEIVVKKLSVLGMTTKRQHAYLRVDLAKMGLTTVDAIRAFSHLQFVNVSGNRLRSLEPLGALRQLLHLNASFNLLTRTQSFAPPNELETIDLSYNLIGDLGDWGVHKFLRELNLRGNFIQRITPGLRRNQELRMLDLSENHISHIENMEGLDLRTLYLAQNCLTAIEGIASLKKLQVLNVKHNEIQSLEPLSANDIPRLRRLCISENQISHIREVERLQSFPYLCDLFLAPNPITELPYYRAQVLHRLPRLRWLDDSQATPEEKIKADVIYGADVEKRQDIFSQLLPEETFVDRRLVTEANIIAMEEEKFGQQGGFADEEDENVIPDE